jgi:hypothetical protein
MDTDTQVFQDIVNEFKNSPILHYAPLGLDVQNGVVTISGRVNSFAGRKAVERDSAGYPRRWTSGEPVANPLIPTERAPAQWVTWEGMFVR